jgi:hypothetical protein
LKVNLIPNLTSKLITKEIKSSGHGAWSIDTSLHMLSGSTLEVDQLKAWPAVVAWEEIEEVEVSPPGAQLVGYQEEEEWARWVALRCTCRILLEGERLVRESKSSMWLQVSQLSLAIFEALTLRYTYRADIRNARFLAGQDGQLGER